MRFYIFLFAIAFSLSGLASTQGLEYLSFSAFYSYVVPFEIAKFMIGDIFLNRKTTQVLYRKTNTL